MAQGLNPADAKRFADFIKADGKTFEEATKSLANNQVRQTELAKQAKENMKAAMKAQEEANAKYVANVQTLINKGKVADINIPDKIIVKVDGKQVVKTKQDFVNYFLVPDFEDEQGNSYTPYEADLYNRNLEDKLKDALMKFMGNDLSSFINLGVKQQQVANIKKLVIGKGKGIVSTSTGGRELVL